VSSQPEHRAVDDRFEQTAVWGRLAADPTTDERVRIIEQMISDGVATILDVGCGDGAITNRLARRWEVTGVDLSAAALAHLEGPAIRASATDLPLPDDSFDLVLSTEMLEHLPTVAYRQAISEMHRVSRRYVLIAVPYREDLAFRTIRCPRCGWRGHVWGHRRKFTAESLLRDLDGFVAIETRTFGPLQPPPWPRWLTWSAHNLLRCYYWAPGQHPMCERCRNTDFASTRAFPAALHHVNRLVRGNEPRMPFWMAVLAEAHRK
jgi:SAM-dependent methyltransferase